MRRSPFTAVLGLAATIAVPLLIAPAATAAPRDRDDEAVRHAAYVRPPSLERFMGEDADIVEVTLSGPLLRSVARILRHENEEVSELVGSLLAVNAVVIDGWDGPEGAIEDMFDDIVDDLDDDYERIVRVQDGDENIRVFVHMDRDDEIDGLLVLIHSDSELVFTNLVGPLRLEAIAAMSDHFEIPGMEHVPDSITNDQRQRHRDRRRKGRDS